MQLSRKHSRERRTFCTFLRTHGNQYQARGMPVAWNKLRVSVHCRWRICRRFPYACGHSTHNSASRALEYFLFLARHENGQERAIVTIWNARTSSCLVIPTLLRLHTQARAQKKKQPSRTWSERLTAACIIGRIGISRVSFCEVVLLLVVVLVACSVLLCLFGCVCTFVRARPCFFQKKYWCFCARL